ncbi:MAG: DUF2344 domain-containing protein, partial [Defluviitaleaceae bacterium]|nr:DUF2344 domain-containing protein [Defluviitaleaceae bacterium]
SIAMPLSLGMTGLNEIFEVYLSKEIDTDSLIKNLDTQMPSGIKILKAEEVSPLGKSAAGLLFGAVYAIKFPCEIYYTPPDELDGIFDGEKIAADSIKVTLAAGSKKNLKPQKFAEVLAQNLGLNIDLSTIKYERMELLL